MVDGVETDQCGAFGVVNAFGDGGIANAHVHLDHALRGCAQQSTDRRRNRPATGHDQHIAGVVLSDMRQCVTDAFDKIDKARHARRLCAPVHPLLQAFAQQTEMVFVQLGRVGFGQRFGVYAVNHRLAVVLVQTGPDQGL